MNSKHLITAILGIVFFVLGVVLLGVFSTKISGPDSEQIKVAATIFPLYDIARNVAGDAAEVELILPPGASPHFYEFSPSRLAKLQGTKIIFAVGHGLDDWAQRIEDAIPGVEVYIVDSGITLRQGEEGGSKDPHYWLNFGNARRIANNIQDVLARIDPEQKGIYELNAGAYNEMLTAKEEGLVDKMIQLQHRKMLMLHDAWYYFANNFNLDIVGTFEPAAGEGPTPKYLAELTKKVRQSNATVIFGEPQIATTALKNFANDNFLSLAILDPIGGVKDRESYVEMMEYNVDVIIGQLGKKE